MTQRVVLIRHENSPKDDRASAHLADLGFQLDWRHPFAGDELGTPDDGVAGTIVYGGGINATDGHLHPFLNDEARWVEQCMGRNIPTLGLCLGGQIIAHALGAAVGPDGRGLHEFGYYPIYPTGPGRAYFPEEITVAQAHYHGFDLPRGAVLLARSELYPHQAFRFGERTFAFQFHPECTIDGFRRWQDAAWAPWGEPGAQSRVEQDALAARHDPAQHAWFTGFLEDLFGTAVGSAETTPAA